MRKNRFQYQFATDPQDMARYLLSLADGFKAGELRLTENNRQMVFKPGPMLELAIDAVRRRGRVSLTLAIAWEENSSQNQLSLTFDQLPEESAAEAAPSRDPADEPPV
jgi:amphi-Trp domain-containing protein